MNCLLVYPAIPTTFWSFTYALKFIRKKAAYPPLGLLTIGAMLPPDWTPCLVDLNIEKLRDADLEWADLVFISAMTLQRESTREIIARCHAMGVKVVAGGPLFTNEPDAIDHIDHLVLGEAELTLPPFLNDLANGRPKNVYRTEAFCDLHNTPVPAWELAAIKKYASLSIQFSRGCPFNCDFCNITTLFGHRPRLKTADQVTAELDAIYATGWRGNVFFVDDNFIGNKGFLKSDLLPALIRWRQDKRGIVFMTETSINLADDPELIALMVKAGFDAVFIGIESPDEASLSECSKKQNKNRDLLQNVRIIQNAGLQVQAGFIVGFDVDSPKTFKRMIDFIQQSGIVTAMVGILQAPPGTRLFKRLKKENRIIGTVSGDNVDGNTNIIPKMGIERLKEGYHSIMTHIYAPKHYYRRVRIFLKEFKVPEARVPLNFRHFLAVLHSSIRLGFFGKERFHYWSLIIWTLFQRPRLLPIALTMAIYGYHFRKICELYFHHS